VGLHNEVDTRTQACYNLTKAFADKIRSLDPSRPLTYASFHPFDDICFELVDIISINKYFGWYEDETADWAKFLTDFKAKLAAAGLGDKPLSSVSLAPEPFMEKTPLRGRNGLRTSRLIIWNTPLTYS